jgi:hypothetical protein
MDDALLHFARLVMAIARRVAPLRLSRYADPTFHPTSLLAALLLREHLRRRPTGPPRTCWASPCAATILLAGRPDHRQTGQTQTQREAFDRATQDG